ncbi:3-oxoacyl-[acyl-carrier-protein] reductase [Wickerhamomyces ciferrii]|uniref:3-oxoacyl-[acyl-carrier-protein] reductase n=1 Tax=Wickerhamomyces ciferrii (strain ATCC 14091 / BCRC 22168 / CBS 111 / JCM 3599 / NBRC 0793 / NRRL Y-1031 F-60-10) TaxID=1206466 RepID=K0KX54_WICCF|nr:3-oxoacyl-[acyl-carrier-protein] reductase [Wickerhamomyces ciferrii]CCH46627.1 3-oxoacyl-[acyl-carrier-protein] reductase [Wickerhamomyces ciferrii]
MSQKVALITGTNSGIGHSLSLELNSRGYKVYATDYKFNEEILKEFANNNIETETLDVRSSQDIKKIHDLIQSKEGRLDLLYNNAGIVHISHCVDLIDEDIENLYEINLFGPMKITRQFTKLLVKSQGTVVFSGSVTKNIPVHSNSLYTSSKAALDQYVSVLQLELRNYNVKVLSVLGGYIKSNIYDTKQKNPIPIDSIYNFDQYNEAFSKRKQAFAKQESKKMETDVFVKRVLNQIENATLDTFRIFEGGHASRLYYTPFFISRSKLVNSMLDLFGLNFNYRDHLTETV